MAASMLLACGCERPFTDETPLCATHGWQRVVRVLGLPPPRIRGVATGPHVTPEDLAPWTGRIAGSEQE